MMGIEDKLNELRIEDKSNEWSTEDKLNVLSTKDKLNKGEQVERDGEHPRCIYCD